MNAVVSITCIRPVSSKLPFSLVTPSGVARPGPGGPGPGYQFSNSIKLINILLQIMIDNQLINTREKTLLVESANLLVMSKQRTLFDCFSSSSSSSHSHPQAPASKHPRVEEPQREDELFDDEEMVSILIQQLININY